MKGVWDMMASERRKCILRELENAQIPMNASRIAKKLGVSRQVIVGDIALLRASGEDIIATPRGYIYEKIKNVYYTIACVHDSKDTLEELYLIVDQGCFIRDVIVEHQVYGQIVGELHIHSRRDADEFMKNLIDSKQEPLSRLTGKIHLHTIECPSEQHFTDLKKEMSRRGFLVE